MEKRRERARRRAGFTLAEVLVTLGIIAVLLALAVPSVAVVRKNLKMTELNATAREIFLAAQNNLTGLSAGGGAVELSARSGAPDEDAAVCLMSGDPDMEKVLPLGAVDPAVAGNHYMVVYYPATLTVREVYYSERALTEEGEELQTKYRGEDKAGARREDEIGFYDGRNITSNPPKTLPKPLLTIENGEELVVKASVPGLTEELIGNVALTVTVSSVEDPKNKFRVYSAAQVGIGGADILLDSLTEGKHFRQVCDGSGIAPGENIRITAKTTYTGSDKNTWLSSEESKVTNSLFAGREGNTVKIACGRHLQNLDTAASGVANTVKKAVQTADIDWHKNGANEFSAIGNEALTGYDGQNNEIRNLAVRQNPNLKVNGVGLFGVTPGLEKMSLSNIRLVNSNVAGRNGLPSGSLIGMVNFGGADVSHCLVYWDGTGDKEACYVSGDRTSTGGLIGSAKAYEDYGFTINISYCGVGLPVIKGDGSEFLGGLVGYAQEVTIKNSYAAVDQLSGEAGQIGGFVGRGEDVNISDCYAVGNISAGRRADDSIISGFVSGNGTVTDSYCAMTYFDEKNEPRALEISYGFMSAMEHPTCAYLEPNSPVMIRNENDKEAQKLTYEELKVWKKSQPWTALSQMDSHSYRELEKDEPKAYPFPGLLTETGSPLPHYGSWPKEPQAAAEADYLVVYYELHRDAAGKQTYGVYYKDDAISFDTLGRSTAPVVWDGYALLCREELPKNAKISVVPAGGGNQGNDKGKLVTVGQVEVSEGDSRWLYPIPSGLFVPQNSPLSTGEFYSKVAVGSGKNEIVFYCNPWFAKTAVLADAAPATPAEAAVRTPRHLRYLGEFTQNDDWNNIYSGLSYAQDADLDYATYLNVDEKTLADGLTGEPYFNLANALKGIKLSGVANTYDGGGKSIAHIPVTLFDSVGKGGTVQNVVITGAKVVRTAETGFTTNDSESGIMAKSNVGTIQACVVRASSIETTAYAAGFVASNNGSISDCSVQGINVRGSYGASGFVVSNSGKIKSCAVYPGPDGKGDYARVSINTAAVASGFVYSNDGTISGCFAVGTVKGGSNAAGFAEYNDQTIEKSYANCIVGAGASASGFVSNNDGTVQDCYALKEVASTGGTAAGFTASNTGGISSSYSAAVVEAQYPTQTYGFAPASTGDVKDAYYLGQDGVAENEAGTALNYDRLEGLDFENSSWEGGGATHPFENTGEYPFPMLTGLDHWGDWPVSSELPAKPNMLGMFHYKALSDGNYQIEAAALELTMKEIDWPPMQRPVGYPKPDEHFWSGTANPQNPGAFDNSFGQIISHEEGIGFFFSKDGGQPASTMTTILMYVNYQYKGNDTPLVSAINGGDIDISENYFFVALPAQKQSDGSYAAELKYFPYLQWPGREPWSCAFTFRDGTVEITPHGTWN